jgi:penicillin-binding protein 2
MKNHYVSRKYVVGSILLLLVLLYLIRLFFLQVIDTSYRSSASNNVLRFVTQYPARGLIYDRNGKLLVYNEAAYDMMVIPSQTGPMDTADLCNVLKLTRDEFDSRLSRAKEYSRYTASIFLGQISSADYAVLQEKMYKFPGFYVQPRTLRKYDREIAAHVLGYVSEVDEADIRTDPYYKMGDFIGKSGVEKRYESSLRGNKGVKIFMVDVHNQIKGSYQGGRRDTVAVVGSDLTLTLDADLQEYGEGLMVNKIGSIVAIEPASGEVLALVSAPDYKPSRLVGRARSKEYGMLENDTLKPLFNRALMAQYPPGSTFKTINALIGLNEHTLRPSTEYYCDLGYYARGVYVGCHLHNAPLNLVEGIQNSCNAYFCNVFRRILDNPKYGNVREGFMAWRNYLTSFGFGTRLESDLSGDMPGFIPELSYYDRYYGQNGWSSLTIVSMAIGQGELLITPIQMANMTASIANRGFYYTPHIVKAFADGSDLEPGFIEKHQIPIDSIHFETVIEGMYLAVNGPPGSGSTARNARVPDVSVCGKTGTAENPHGEDHSIFIAFAPKEDPRIAIAVYVENGGFGNTYAAPIAGLMIEKYLKRNVTNTWFEDYIINTDLIHIDSTHQHMD